jgi:hypothetical protein
MSTSPNPFEVLRLDPASGPEEVVRQAGRLRQRAADENAVAAIRQAVQALTGPPEERMLHALLTHPGPCYHWPAVERFVTAFRRLSPAPEAGTERPLDLADVVALLGLPEMNEEATRHAVEALWSCLLAEGILS